MVRTLRLLSLLMASLMASCAYQMPMPPEPGDPQYAPVWTQPRAQQQAIPGAIYQPATASNLYQRRAHRLGDVLTINLNEATTARKSSGTSYSKESSTTVPSMSLFETGLDTASSLGSGSEFGGSSNSDQSNQLIGNITVTVTDVLQIRGEKWLQLNKGNEFIRISGLVRRQDISPDNSIASTRIADVRIAYSGTGSLADVNEPGLLSRFFVGPWWPL